MNILTPDADVSRRTALALFGGAAAAGALPRIGLAAAAMPWLATPAQVRAEGWLLELLEDPELKRLQAELRAELAASPRATTIPDAAATLDRAIALWTNSLLFGELCKDTTNPAFLWGTDDTPREWLGHHLGGVGTSGDNPDAIYRTAAIDGGGRYEIVGQYHPSSRPVQVLIEIHATDLTRPSTMMTPTAKGDKDKSPDPHSAAQIDQDSFVVDAQGRFRITLGGPGEGSANHLPIPAEGLCIVGVRDILSDWTQRASGLTIRRLDGAPRRPFGIEDVRKAALADLPGYVRFWAKFPDIWFGGLKPNTISAPQARPGGWGFVAGLNYHLAADEALLVTTTRGGAKYTGFQINDPWMIQPDVRTAQASLNISQVTPNSDGSVTYVVAPRDPGAANWLDTTGLHDGLAILRWQAVPNDLRGNDLIREFRVVKASELAGLTDLPRVTPAERKARVVARKGDYETRVR